MAAPLVFPPSSRTSISSSQLAAPVGYEAMDQQASVYHDAPMSFGCFDRIEPALMATFVPCFTIARHTTHNRLDFAFVFLAVLLLYVGGIVSFIMASRVTDSVTITVGEETQLLAVMAAAWGTYILGPWSTLPVDVYLWLVWAIHNAFNEDPEDIYDVSGTAVFLLAVHFVIQLLLTVVMSALFFKLLLRKSRSCCAECGWYCLCCCCPSCALGGAIESSQRIQDEGVDEMPAYRV